MLHFGHHAAHLRGAFHFVVLANAAQAQGQQGVLLALGALDLTVDLGDGQLAHVNALIR